MNLNKPLRILVIEDNPGDFELIGEYLAEAMPSSTLAHAASFGKAKGQLSEKNVFDIILLDLTLPDERGEELIRKIIDLAADIPVVALTGFSDLDFSIRSLSLGISDYLVKDDMNAAILSKSIFYTLERKRIGRALRESEKRYVTLFEMNPQAIWVVDRKQLHFFKVNKAVEDSLGYTREQLANKRLKSVIAEDPDNLLEQSLTAKPEQAVYGRLVLKAKNNQLLHLDISCTPISIEENDYLLFSGNDVTEKILLDNQITKAIIKAQEDERYEIGAELHDNVCQILAGSQMSLGLLKSNLQGASLEYYTHCRDNLSLASTEIRNLSHRLAPVFFDDKKLEEAFLSLINTFNIDKRYNIQVHIAQGINEQLIKMGRDIQLNLYRILQEQLRNILKYAKANEIEISVIHYNNRMLMTVSDNGVGFDVQAAKRGIGLQNIKRRAELFSGSMEVISSPGNGCELVVRLPINGGEEQAETPEGGSQE
jgi:two-component system sensor histidine kinase UhpB